MRSLSSFKYVLNPRSPVNRPEVTQGNFDTLRVTNDKMRDQPYEYNFQPMEDGRIFVTPRTSPNRHRTVLLPKPGTNGRVTLLDFQGRPIPVVGNVDYRDKSYRRQQEEGLFPDDVGKTIVLNSPDEAAQFISNITQDSRYNEYNPDLNISRHQQAAERVLAYKQKRFKEVGDYRNILRGDVPVKSKWDVEYSDDDIDRIISRPSLPNTVRDALEASAYIKAARPVQASIPTDTYSDIPSVEPTVLRDIRAGLRGESTPPPRPTIVHNNVDTSMTEGFDFSKWKANRKPTYDPIVDAIQF